MRAEIVGVGTELLLGQIANENARCISERLAEIGVDVLYHQAVGDNLERIAATLKLALSRADVVIVTGGLGPTQDDITREGLALAIDVRLERRPEIEAFLRERFSSRGREMPEMNLQQADVPEGGRFVLPERGTAPALAARTADGKRVYLVAGVPAEMREMMDRLILPELRELAGPAAIVSRILKVAGVAESRVAEMLDDVFRGSENPSIAYLAGSGEVKVRVTAKAGTREEAEAMIEPVAGEVARRLGAFVYSEEGEDLEQTVGRLLRERGMTVACAESLTGGSLAFRLSRAEGASDVLPGFGGLLHGRGQDRGARCPEGNGRGPRGGQRGMRPRDGPGRDADLRRGRGDGAHRRGRPRPARRQAAGDRVRGERARRRGGGANLPGSGRPGSGSPLGRAGGPRYASASTRGDPGAGTGRSLDAPTGRRGRLARDGPRSRCAAAPQAPSAVRRGRRARRLRAGLAGFLEPFRDRIPGASWPRRDGWHVTLRFLGSTWPRQVEAVRTAVEKAAAAISPFETSLTEVGAFPSERRARVLWVGLDDDGGVPADRHAARRPPPGGLRPGRTRLHAASDGRSTEPGAGPVRVRDEPSRPPGRLPHLPGRRAGPVPEPPVAEGCDLRSARQVRSHRLLTGCLLSNACSSSLPRVEPTNDTGCKLCQTPSIESGTVRTTRTDPSDRRVGPSCWRRFRAWNERRCST